MKLKIKGQALWYLPWLLLVVLGWGGLVIAQEPSQSSSPEISSAQEILQLLERSETQQIPMANERFRIDGEIDEITLVLFRNPDTPSSVIVLPDGTKWYSSRHPREQVTWRTGHDYDVIAVKSPMVGPWQVTGHVRQESRVMVLSEVQFHPEPFPQRVFVGEQLKVTGTVSNGEQPIEQKDFRSIIRLDVYFISTNNPEFDNFGQGMQKIGEFLDDGRQFDQKARDGIFTGQLQFNLVPGEYIPRYHVKTPLFERYVEASSVLVSPSPIQYRVTFSEQEGEPHWLHVDMDEELMQLDEVLVELQVIFPNGEKSKIILDTHQGDDFNVKLSSFHFGLFVVTGRVAATSVGGRDFVAQIPMFEFRAIPKQRSQYEDEATKAALIEAQRVLEEHEAELLFAQQQRQTLRMKVILVVSVNLLLVALWTIMMVFRRNRIQAPKDKKKKLKVKSFFLRKKQE